MEVQHIKLFSLEQFAHLAKIRWAQRDRTHGAVERNAEAFADADHIAFGCLLESVAARDDANVVATCAKYAVETADVIVDAPRHWIDIWSDETDFHLCFTGRLWLCG